MAGGENGGDVGSGSLGRRIFSICNGRREVRGVISTNTAATILMLAATSVGSKAAVSIGRQ